MKNITHAPKGKRCGYCHTVYGTWDCRFKTAKHKAVAKGRYRDDTRTWLELRTEIDRLESLLTECLRCLEINKLLPLMSTQLRDYRGQLQTLNVKKSNLKCAAWKD